VSSAGADGARAPTTVGWWASAIAFAVLLAIAGVVRPRIALAAAIALALGVTALLVAYLGRRLADRVQPISRSEFAPAVYQRPPQVLPHHLARIAPDPVAKRPPLSAGARAGIVTVATERLWAHHGLNLHDPTHHDRIRRLVPADVWSVIRPDRVEADGRVAPRPPLPHADLTRLLDDLERI
jgi:hypothetical protein